MYSTSNITLQQHLQNIEQAQNKPILFQQIEMLKQGQENLILQKGKQRILMMKTIKQPTL